MKHVLRSLILPFFLLLIGANALAADKTARPDFAMKDLDGKVHKLSDYRGQYVILNFWATWCPPCLEELPDLFAYQKDNPNDVVLGINFEEIETQYLKAFVAEQNFNFPVLPIGDHVLPALEPINGLPTTIILTPEGQVIAKHTGPLTRQMLEDFLTAERLAAQGSQSRQAAN